MNHIVRLIPILLLVGLSNSAYGGAGFSLQGRILKPDNSPVDGANVQFKVQIRSGGSEDCLLYQETQALDLRNTNGLFSLVVGNGTRASSIVDGGYSIDRIFANRGSLDFSTTSPSACLIGTTFSPSAAQGRRLVYSFNDGSGWQTVPAMAITWVPQSLESLQVGGYQASQLLRVTDASGVPQNAPNLTPTQATELMNLITGATTQYIKPGAATFSAAPQYSGTVSGANDLTNKAYVDAAVATATSSGLPDVGTAGTYTKVTTDAKGRVTAGATLAEADIPTLSTAGKVSGAAINTGTIGGNAAINTSGNIVTSGTVSSNIVSGNSIRLYDGATNYVSLAAPTLSGIISFKLPAADGSAGQVLKTDGSGNLGWVSVTSGTVTSVTSGGAPITVGGTAAAPTISITQSGASSDGYLSSTDWNTFNNKLGTASAFSGDVTGTSSTTSVDKIKGKAVVPVAYSAGQTLRYDGTNWVNTALPFADLASKPTTLAGYGITDAASNTLADGKIFVGNGSNVATAVTMSGDATLSNAGVLTLNTVTTSKGGTGSTSFTANQLVGTNGTGTALTSFSCTTGQILAFGASGVAGCENVNGAGLVTRLDSSANLNLASSIVITGSAAPAVSAAGKGQIYFDSTANKFKISQNGGAYTDLVSGGTVTTVTANAPLSVTTGSTTPDLSIAQANTTTSGYITSTDWNTFNNKQSTTLNSAQIWIGNGSNVATARTASGDVSLDNAGVFAVNRIKGYPLDFSTTPTSGKVLKFDGTSWAPATDAGGLASFNGSSQSTQTLETPGTSGTAPNWSTNTGTGAHTLNIPLASTASVTAGLLSKTKYDEFDAKLGTASTFSGDVSGTASTISVEKIRGKNISPAAYAAGQTLRYNGTQWVNATLDFADLSNKPTTLAGYGITDASSSTLADGKIFVGNGSNVATAVTLSGDATIANTGVLTLNTVPVAKGGTGRTSFGNGRVLTTHSTTGVIQDTTCSQYQVISFDASGNWYCANVNSLSGSFVDGGNTFTADATLGNNGNFGLGLKTNNAVRMTISNTGNVGIGTTNPGLPLHVKGTAAFESASADSVGSNFSLWKSRNYAAVLNNDELGYISSWGHDGTGLSRSSYLLSSVDGAVATNSVPGRIQFATTTVGDSDATVKMTIRNDGKVGIGTTSPNSILDVNGAITQRGMAAPAVSPAGEGVIYFDSTANKFKVSQNGAAYVDLVGGGSSGMTSLNGSTQASQTFATPGTSGTAPGWSTVAGTGVHTLNIPMASTASVTAGLISKTDYDAFNGKLGTSLTSAQIFVGNASNVATGVSMTGDASISNTGALTLNTVTVGKGGTGATTLTSNGVLLGNGTSAVSATAAGTADQVLRVPAGGGAPAFGSIDLSKSAAVTGTLGVGNGGTGQTTFGNSGVIVSNLTGTGLDSLNCVSGQVITFNASGYAVCGSASATGYANGGNSFGVNATIGLNDNFNLGFETNGSTRMTIESGGEVGIGTTAPTAQLEVVTTGTADPRGIVSTQYSSDLFGAEFNTKKARGTLASPSTVVNGDYLSLYASYAYTGSSWVSPGFFGYLTKGTITSTSVPSDFIITTGSSSMGVERFRIDSAGEVGIGTSSPAASLHVVTQNANNPRGIITDQYSTDNAGSWLVGRKARGTAASPTAIANGDWITAWHSMAWDGTSYVDGGYMAFVSNGTVATGSVPTDFILYTGTSGMGSERIRVLSGGNVGIANSGATALLHVGSGSVTAGTTVAKFQSATGTCSVTPNTGMSCASDERLKQNFADITGDLALDKLLKLQAVSYEMRAEPGKRQTGYIAQRVREIAPELVREDKDTGFLEVFYTGLIPWITESIKSLHERLAGQEMKLSSHSQEIQNLKAENAAKEQKIKELEQRLERIEQALQSK